MFERLANDETAPWIWHNLNHPEFAKPLHEYNSWYWAVLYTHEWFVNVLQDDTHEEHWMLWGRHDEENTWPDSELLARRNHPTMAITPIPFHCDGYEMRSGFIWSDTPMWMPRNHEEDPRF